MSDLKIGNFNSVMQGLEDDVAEMEVEQLPDDSEYGEDKSEELLPSEKDEKEEEETPEEEDIEEDTEEDEEEETEDEEEEKEGTEPDAEPADEIKEGEEKEEEKEEEDDDEPILWTVKVDGKEREVDEEELLRGYQTAQSSTKRFSEAKKLHQEATTFWRQFTSEDKNPGDSLVAFLAKQNGGDHLKARIAVRDKFLEFLAPDLEESLIEDEKEKELHRQKREIEIQRKALEEEKAAAKSRLEKEAEDEFISDVRTLTEAQLKKFKLPLDNDLIWDKTGKYLATASAAGSSREEIKEMIPMVIKKIRDERAAEAKTLVSTLSAEEMEQLFPEQLKEMKKKRIAKVKAKKSKKVKTDSSGTIKDKKKSESKKSKKRRSDDIFGEIDFRDFSD
jgi:hypothetical protein